MIGRKRLPAPPLSRGTPRPGNGIRTHEAGASRLPGCGALS